MVEGERLAGRYRVVDRLGTGGMSEVWRGHDEVLDRPVAIKTAASRLAADPVMRRRIRGEAKAAARLSHPHITAVYDYGESSGPDAEPIPFVVMEVVDGMPMEAHLASGAGLPWRVAVRACAQVAAALAAAHEHGIVHRDIKPGNVMLTPAGAKVLDFGISALVGEPDVDEDGSLFGTPAYLAPERLDGGPVTPACDVYALGLLLYRALTGRLPWPAGTTTQTLKAHLRVEPRPLPPVDGLPPEVAALCELCLAKDPHDRPSSANAASELNAILDAPSVGVPVPVVTPVDAQLVMTQALSPTVLRPASARRPRRRALVATGLLTSTAAVLAAAAWPSGNPAEHDAAAAVAGNASPRPGTCKVEYRVSRDTGSAVIADLAITNTGTEPLHSWQLAFDLAGDQRLRRGTNATWHQQGNTVTASADGAVLSPTATARLTVTVGYRTKAPMPASYDLNGASCLGVVLVAPAPGRSGTSPAPAGGNTVKKSTVDNGPRSENARDQEKGKGKGKH